MRHFGHRGHGHGQEDGACGGFMRGMRGGPGSGFGPGWGRGEGGEGRGPHRRGGPGRHGGGRMFEHGALKWLLLSLIAEKPSHGYELIKAVETKLGGAYSPSPGVIYPTLTLLEEMGALSSEAEGGKKLYSITDDGRALLEENAEAVAAVQAVAARFGGRRARPEAVEAAVGRLRAAMHSRLTAETPLTEAQIEAIAALLNQAADGIEGA